MNAMGTISLGFIRSPRADFLWFVALPPIALLIAFFFHNTLPYVAQASVAVWVTAPHHYAGWVRGYGLDEDWTRWKNRLILGPIILIPSIVLGTAMVPVTLGIVFLLWDHQHSLMQQYGFARIYDFKAGTDAAFTKRFDFILSVLLYGNMLITAPLWAELWIAELHRWGLALDVEAIRQIQAMSWMILGAFAVIYVGHVIAGAVRGDRFNPMKYLFLLSSYGLWYFVSWQDSFLLYIVAHRIMHGVQYILMVYWYVERKADRTGKTPLLLSNLSLSRFLLLGGAYAIVFHLVTGGNLSHFSFGLINSLQMDPILNFSLEKATGFYAATAVSAASACHYYLDSYIWKIRDPQIQEGL
jgi:hypothetical protein